MGVRRNGVTVEARATHRRRLRTLTLLRGLEKRISEQALLAASTLEAVEYQLMRLIESTRPKQT